MDLIPAFACGLGFGACIGVALGLAWAAWSWRDDAYRHGLEDADGAWKAAISKDAPFRCNAVPLDPFKAMH